nr:unnamed protein product [uncultured bacterium]
MAKKDDYIRVRITTEQKKLFKNVATELGTNMSEMMIAATEDIVKRHMEKMLSQKNITERAIKTEKKLAEIKEKMKIKREEKK